MKANNLPAACHGLARPGEVRHGEARQHREQAAVQPAPISEMKTVTIKIAGMRPLVMHNGQLADPTNVYTRAIKKIISKGSKKLTDSDYEERDRLEWLGGLYWSDELKAIAIPSDNFERCIQDGAKKNRLGKDFAAAVFLQDAEVVIHHRLSGKTKEAIATDPGFTIRKGVKVQLARIIRVRPMVPTGWTATFTIEFDDTIVNRAQVVTATEEAGALVGLGDHRPKFGRFSVEVVEVGTFSRGVTTHSRMTGEMVAIKP